MEPAAGIEKMHFVFEGAERVARFEPVLVGVVGSGNLEVLVEPGGPDSTLCDVDVETSARGFAAIWDAVLSDFHARHRLAGIRISINDMGATPAVVSLRLDQAVADFGSPTTQGASP